LPFGGTDVEVSSESSPDGELFFCATERRKPWIIEPVAEHCIDGTATEVIGHRPSIKSRQHIRRKPL
jgi:hypothetical protein